jgi:hypothetical protein
MIAPAICVEQLASILPDYHIPIRTAREVAKEGQHLRWVALCRVCIHFTTSIARNTIGKTIIKNATLIVTVLTIILLLVELKRNPRNTLFGYVGILGQLFMFVNVYFL